MRGRRINPDGTSDIQELDTDSKEFLRKVKASRITINVPFYKILGIAKKGNNSVKFQKQ